MDRPKGDPVYGRDFPAGQTWLPGLIREVQGPTSVVVELDDGRIVRRHVDHARSCVVSTSMGDCVASTPAPLKIDSE